MPLEGDWCPYQLTSDPATKVAMAQSHDLLTTPTADIQIHHLYTVNTSRVTSLTCLGKVGQSYQSTARDAPNKRLPRAGRPLHIQIPLFLTNQSIATVFTHAKTHIASKQTFRSLYSSIFLLLRNLSMEAKDFFARKLKEHLER